MRRTPPALVRLPALHALAAAVLCVVPAPAGAQADAPWYADVVMSAPGKLGGCAVGNLDPEHDGNEIASVCVTGQVFLSRPYGRRWVSEAIAQAPGEGIQCAIGDADPEHPGDELVVVGMKAGTEDDGGPGAAFLVRRTSGEVEGAKQAGWELEPLLEDSALIHACAIADVDPDAPGREVVLAGFSRTVHVLTRSGGRWTDAVVCTLDGPAKSLQPFEGGVAVACANGELVLVAKEDGSWTRRVLDDAPAGQSRLGASGDRLIVARDDGVLALVTAAGRRSEIYREADRLRGAVLAELDPASPGPEAATAGYERKLSVLYHAGDEWIARVVHTDVDRLHHLAVGELDAESPGLELVACGYSGRLIVAGRAGTAGAPVSGRDR